MIRQKWISSPSGYIHAVILFGSSYVVRNYLDMADSQMWWRPNNLCHEGWQPWKYHDSLVKDCIATCLHCDTPEHGQCLTIGSNQYGWILPLMFAQEPNGELTKLTLLSKARSLYQTFKIKHFVSKYCERCNHESILTSRFKRKKGMLKSKLRVCFNHFCSPEIFTV